MSASGTRELTNATGCYIETLWAAGVAGNQSLSRGRALPRQLTCAIAGTVAGVTALGQAVTLTVQAGEVLPVALRQLTAVGSTVFPITAVW